MICGSSNHGAFYTINLTIYSTSNDTTSDSLDILVPNSNSSSRHGDINAMRKSVEMFEPRVKTFMGMVRPEDCFLWKIAYLPKLNTWVSSSGKATVIGDAAHAMVPHLGMVHAIFPFKTSLKTTNHFSRVQQQLSKTEPFWLNV
jgi:salicylate hydroxylase